MNQRSQQFADFVRSRMLTKAYKRTARWIAFRIWLYRLFSRRTG